MAVVAARRNDDASEARAPRAPRRQVTPRPVLPSGRAVVGGLLLAVAVVGTFTAWQRAAGGPDTSYAVARRPLQPGEQVTADHVRLVPAELDSGSADRAFRTSDAVVGRVALGPIGEGELIQRSLLCDAASTTPLTEVSFALPRDRAVDGRLRSGDRVDVFVTYDDHTGEVVQGAQVIGIGGSEAAASLAGDLDLTVTLGLEDGARRAELVHAVRAGDVTLVRSTQSGETTDRGDGDVYRPDGPPVRSGG
jgi:Flp pilus assembly protein CpaB